MKIAFFHEFGKAIGGGGYALIRLSEELAKMGHDVRLFGVDPKNKLFVGRDLPSNLTVTDRVYFPFKFKGSGRIDHMLQSIFAETVVLSHLRKHNVDYIVGALRESAIIATKLSKRSNAKSLNFVYESPPLMDHDLKERWHQEYKGRFKNSWDLTKAAYKRSDILVAISHLTMDWCNKWLGKQQVKDFVYPAIDPKESDAIPAQKIKNQIIYVGRMNEYKNIDSIIKALHGMKDAPKLMLVGGGPQTEELKELAEKMDVETEFCGKVTEVVKWKSIKESLFMVFPTSHEGFGMPPMEALACGRPCLCSDKQIFHEVYGDKVEYFKEQDIDDLRDMINRLRNNKKYLDARGKKGHSWVIKNFSWMKSAKKLEAIMLGGLS